MLLLVFAQVPWAPSAIGIIGDREARECDELGAARPMLLRDQKRARVAAAGAAQTRRQGGGVAPHLAQLELQLRKRHPSMLSQMPAYMARRTQQRASYSTWRFHAWL